MAEWQVAKIKPQLEPPPEFLKPVVVTIIAVETNWSIKMQLRAISAQNVLHMVVAT